MTTSSASGTALISQIEDAELSLAKGPLVTFFTTLQNPASNFLTVQNAAANVALTFPQLTGPAQAALINILATFMLAKVNSLPSTPAA